MKLIWKQEKNKVGNVCYDKLPKLVQNSERDDLAVLCYWLLSVKRGCVISGRAATGSAKESVLRRIDPAGWPKRDVPHVLYSAVVRFEYPSEHRISSEDDVLSVGCPWFVQANTLIP
jgi:hypothetical protein